MWSSRAAAGKTGSWWAASKEGFVLGRFGQSDWQLETAFGVQEMVRAYIAIALLIAFCMSFVGGPVFGQRRQTQQYIRISKETTWLTEPLTSDGYVDYSAAINAINVVPQEDNAAATLIELAGVPKYWEQAQRDKLRRSLGLSALPECGDSLKSEYEFTHDLEDAGLPIPDDDNQFEQGVLASSQPWTAVEAPFIDRWIGVNSKHLAKVDVILAKSGYFEPMIPCRERTPTIVPASCDIAKNARWKITELLVSRCFRHLGEQRFEEAIHDLVRIHKLAQLGQKGKLVFGLVDNTHLERHALVVGEKMLEARDLDRDSLSTYLKALSTTRASRKGKRPMPLSSALPSCLHDALRTQVTSGVRWRCAGCRGRSEQPSFRGWSRRSERGARDCAVLLSRNVGSD